MCSLTKQRRRSLPRTLCGSLKKMRTSSSPSLSPLERNFPRSSEGSSLPPILLFFSSLMFGDSVSVDDNRSQDPVLSSFVLQTISSSCPAPECRVFLVRKGFQATTKQISNSLRPKGPRSKCDPGTVFGRTAALTTLNNQPPYLLPKSVPPMTRQCSLQVQ